MASEYRVTKYSVTVDGREGYLVFSNTDDVIFGIIKSVYGGEEITRGKMRMKDNKEQIYLIGATETDLKGYEIKIYVFKDLEREGVSNGKSSLFDEFRGFFYERQPKSATMKMKKDDSPVDRNHYREGYKQLPEAVRKVLETDEFPIVDIFVK